MAASMLKCQKFNFRIVRQFFTCHSLYQQAHSNKWIINHSVSLDPRIKAQADDVKALNNHPGALSKTCNAQHTQLPSHLVDAIIHILEKYPIARLKDKSAELTQYLWSRHIPVDPRELRKVAEVLEDRYVEKEGIDREDLGEEEIERLDIKIEREVTKRLKATVYHWKPVQYDAFKSVLYMIGRMPSDYASMYRIFHEIASRDDEFKPRTLLDFGSGVGSTVWAANSIWEKQIYEHIMVDASADMNTLARLLMQDGEEQNETCFQGIHIRQSFPASTQHTFDLVVSAFSLMELESSQQRIKTILSMWRKTENYLVIVELGTNAGFKLVSEARDFVLRISEYARKPKTISKKVEKLVGEIDSSLEGHVFAPCSHRKACPMLAEQEGVPCNFEQKYEVSKHLQGKGKTGISRFSYVILKKGRKKAGAPKWSRLVRANKMPPKQVICIACTPKGTLESHTLTKAKHGPCAKACKWGDLLPTIPDETVKSSGKKHTKRKNKERVQTSEYTGVEDEFDSPVENNELGSEHVEIVNTGQHDGTENLELRSSQNFDNEQVTTALNRSSYDEHSELVHGDKPQENETRSQ